MRPKGRIKPSECGCWYCWHADGEMLFSLEFDCFLHLQCLKDAIHEINGEEEKIFLEEFRSLL